VIIKEKEEYNVERILNKRMVKEKKKYLVQWKRYIVEADI